jgi:parallel beta-helix repeat protein
VIALNSAPIEILHAALIVFLEFKFLLNSGFLPSSGAMDAYPISWKIQMFTRRELIGALSATIAARPARATTGTVFDRDVVVFSPVAGEASVHGRLNDLIARLSEAGGGTIRLTPGIYPTRDSIILLDNIRLVGSGMAGEFRSTIRLVDGAPPMGGNAGILRLKRDGVPLDLRVVRNVAVEYLEVDGNRTRQRQDVEDAEKKYGLYAEVHDCLLRRVTIRDCMGYGFDPHGTADLKPSKRILIEDCAAIGNMKDGFTLDQQEDMVMRHCLSQGNGRAGINIVTSTCSALVENNVVRENGGSGIFVQNGSHTVHLHRNQVVDNAHNGIFLRDSQDMEVTDNYVAGNLRGGVRVNGGRGIAIRGNTVLHNLADGKTRQSEVFLDLHDEAAPAGVDISRNHIDAQRNAAIMDCDGATGTRVTDNVYDARDPKGIVLHSQDPVADRNTRLRLSRWFTAEDPLAQSGTNWLLARQPDG